jgi:hypothetical protein
MAGKACALDVDNWAVDQDRVFDISVMSCRLTISARRAPARHRGTLAAQQLARAHAHRAQELDLARCGGVFRYSMISGTLPLCRIMASVLREVPQDGL